MHSEKSDRRLEEISAHAHRANGVGTVRTSGDIALVDTSKLICEMGEQMMELAKKEIELAKAEAKVDLEAEVSSVKRLAVAGLCGVLAVNMILVAIVFALSPVVYGWLTSLVLAMVLLTAAAALAREGWSQRVKSIMYTTRQTLREDVQWAKRRFRRV